MMDGEYPRAHLRMDEAQPRILDRMAQGLLSTPMDRPDGPLKVSGRAPYAAEHAPEGLAHGWLVRATVARGRVTGMNEAEVLAMPGVLGLHTERMLRNPAQGQAHQAPEQALPEVQYFGQPVAVVVAEGFEEARHAAAALRLSYEEGEAEVDPEAASEVDRPEGKQLDQGDLEAALAGAAHVVDALYTTAPHSSAPMEPHASVAVWEGDRLTLWGSYQMLKHNKAELADALGVPEEKVRILSPYVGGGFGSKLGIAPEAVAAAVAARALGRPVRVVMARTQVFEATMRRSETRQRIRLGADAEGRLTALAQEDRVSNLPGEVFSEPVAQGTHMLYGGAARRLTHEVARVNRTCAGSVRAPGEAVGLLATEGAMDELAEAAGIDPVELRLRNIPEEHPETGVPYSERALARCLREGAEAFGWADRPAMASRREGEWWIGMGMASAVRKNMLIESVARVTLRPDGTALVETDMTDIGTGSYAILTQIAGEALGLPAERVETRLGDTDLPPASGSGGSAGAQSAGSSVFLACRGLRARLAQRMEVDEADLTLKDGIAIGGNRRVPLAELTGDAPMYHIGHIEKGDTAESYSTAGYGAHFAEVAVHAFTGEVRVRRMLWGSSPSGACSTSRRRPASATAA